MGVTEHKHEPIKEWFIQRKHTASLGAVSEQN